MEETVALSKSKELLIGLNKVQKALLSATDQDREQLVVFILNDQETQEITKHLVSYCRQNGVHSYLLPKFLK
jgi:ribosomal protein L7Ae-like RNA K-turn-binding protein